MKMQLLEMQGLVKVNRTANMLVSSAIDRAPVRLIKNYRIDICCFSVEHAALRSKG